MDLLRARAFLDILLGIDSRPVGTGTGNGPGQDSAAGEDSKAGQDVSSGPDGGPGYAGGANLTIPLATLLHLANRPGAMTGIGPLDPDLARDLAAAAARTARSTWCVTVTD